MKLLVAPVADALRKERVVRLTKAAGAHKGRSHLRRDETTISTFFTCSPEAYNSAASFEVALPTADAFKSHI